MYESFWCRSSELLPLPRRMVSAPVAIAVALPLILAAQKPAQALSFRFDYDSRVPDDFRAVTEVAAAGWSSALKDDVVVDLRIEYEDLSEYGAVLGGAQPGKVDVKYEDYASALFRDAASVTDLSAVNSLPLSSEGRQFAQSFQLGSSDVKKDQLKSESFNFLMDGRFGRDRNRGQSFIDSNGSSNNKKLSLTKAQARALGLDGGKHGLDGRIKLNSSVDWDIDRSDGIASDRYDAISVLQHEIGHVLGVVSGVDTLDFLASASDPVDIDKNKFSYLTPLDLYRYSEESAGLGVADLTLGGEKYFSLDGGESAVVNEDGQRAYFSTGSESVGGDGYQASHWKPTDTPLGVVTSRLQAGQSIDISQLDLTLLDSIGWDTKDNNDQKAADIGLDWQQLTNDFAQQRSAVTDRLIQDWGSQIPEFESALADASAETDLKFQEKFRKEFDKLVEKVDDGKLKDRDKEVSKFRKKIRDEADKRNDKIGDLPEEIYKIDQKVGEWLTLSEDKLSDKVKDANGAEINRLSNLVKTASAEERAVLEPKLGAALARFADEPDKLLEELLDSSGPSNPHAWGLGYSSWWYSQVAYLPDGESEVVEDPGLLYATGEVDLGFENLPGEDGDTDFSQISPLDLAAVTASSLAERSADTQDIPEPSSVLALFGIAVLGLGATRRKNRS